jgi:hypothetical protein
VLQPSPLSPSFTYYLPCSDGKTALKHVIDSINKADVPEYMRESRARKVDIAAYLRNIGAPE